MTSTAEENVLELLQMSKIDSGWDSRSDEHIFNIILNFFGKKLWSTIFAVRSLLRLFKGPLKSLSNASTAKMVDQNFFDKNFKIMSKTCLSDLKAHPESIFDVWITSRTNFLMVEVMSFWVLFLVFPTAFPICINCPFLEKRKNRFPNSIDPKSALISPPPPRYYLKSYSKKKSYPFFFDLTV